MSDRDLRTRFSMQALDLATMFQMSFGQKRFGNVGYVAELAKPNVSTGGGKQAMQPIRMNPSQKGFSVLTVGAANPVERRVELRSYEYVDRVHRERFAKAVPLDRAAYNQFLTEANAFFGQWGMAVTMTMPPAGLATAAEPVYDPPSGSGSRILIAVLIAAVAGLTALVVLLLRRG
jgi:hypothetical protein